MKRTVIVTNKSGAHLPAAGRLGPGTHRDIELNDEQLASLKSQGCEIVSGKTAKNNLTRMNADAHR